MTDENVPHSREDEPSSSLLLRVKAQDKDAWERLVHLYAPLVYDWCRRRAGLQEADARDVGQEVFQAVWRNIHEFRRDRPGDSFRGWLRVITRGKIVDWQRRRPPEAALPQEGDALARIWQAPPQELLAEQAGAEQEEVALLYQRAAALIQAHFEEKTWRAFEAVVLNDQAPADVAEQLRMSVNSVYLAKARVLKRLRAEFADLIEP